MNLCSIIDQLGLEKIKEVLEILESNKIEFRDVERIAAELKQAPVKDHQHGEYKSLKEIMFSILYHWRQREPRASKSLLAKVFLRCKLTNIAVKLDPTCKYIFIFIFSKNWIIFNNSSLS